MDKKKKIFWLIVCLILSVLCFRAVYNIFNMGHDLTYYEIQGLAHEEKNSLDGVYIGSSNVHAFWQPPFAWADHGIAVRSYSVNSLPMASVVYMIEEARKTQPDALFIINANLFKNEEFTYVTIHRMTNYFSASLNKLRLINALADKAGYSFMDRLEFYFPIIRFHSRWSKLTSFDFLKEDSPYKGALDLEHFFINQMDLTGLYSHSKGSNDLTEDQNRLLTEILDYCDENGVRVLFVTVPQALGKGARFYRQMNTIEKIIRDRGYDYLNVLDNIEETGIQLDTDFYNERHTNVHGSNKYTEYLSQYLIENYGFSDKRGQPGYESWDKAAEEYLDLCGFYLLPIERSHEKRDYTLEIPGRQTISMEGQTITLTWDAVTGAEGYAIFRRRTDLVEKNWIEYASTDGNTLEFIDSDLLPDVKYYYIIVPTYERDGSTYYGKFDFSGIGIVTEAAEY